MAGNKLMSGSTGGTRCYVRPPLSLALNKSLYDVVHYASCGCPAGKGPNGSCKHIGEFCYAPCDFCKCGNIPGFLIRKPGKITELEQT